MEWNQVLEHPSLQNIPFKVELNEWGNIVMTPASNLHGNPQVKIVMKLMQFMKEGEVSAEVSVHTSKNVKVAFYFKVLAGECSLALADGSSVELAGRDKLLKLLVAE